MTKKLKHNGFKKARVLIVEDQPLTRNGLRMLLENQPGIQVCSEAGDYQQALTAIADAKPHLVTVEVMLNRACGLEWIKEVRLRFPKVRLLVISGHDEVLYAERVLRAGALGYVHKQEALAGVVEAVQTVLRGDIYVSEPVAAKIAAKMAGRHDRATSILDVLTDRELQIFGLLGEGLGPIQIGEQLGINKSTVETYRDRIKKKLRFQNAAAMRQQAILWKRSQEAPSMNPNQIRRVAELLQ